MDEIALDRTERIETGIRLATRPQKWTIERGAFNRFAPSYCGWILTRGDRSLHLYDADLPDWIPVEHLTNHAKAVVDRMLNGFWCGYGFGRDRAKAQLAAVPE